ncbi:uncharacterized protein N7511_006462 [Penicillium nucicola]|uniref:uncharacterized protein n=1 Tax=Penicillium nucicola TaxID=1850975 RepID=UPI00254585ED|nr:uncharacterized protein N7511_006462 [Penicillium nucicola]KAJ5757768.1 hypothetical protein N7511_006462 [Penicillium nucicola]
MELLHQARYWDERLEHSTCPRCGSLPVESIVLAPCLHQYCGQCFDELPDENGSTTTVTRFCTICQLPITSASFYSDLTVSSHVPMFMHHSSQEIFMPNASSKKRKRSTHRKKAHGKGAQQGNIDQPNQKPPTMCLRKGSPREESEDSSGDEMDLNYDWIPYIGHHMPGTKLEAIRELVAAWMEEDNKVKIVVFTQFLATLTLVEYLCERNGWKYMKMSGKMSIAAREEGVKAFRDDDRIQVLISSLKTGGVGLDLSMANKCILVDLWWNEAIQDQAYCRLYRIGQTRKVEYVKLVMKETIDEYVYAKQKEKTRTINTVMSPNALGKKKDTIKDMLSIFGEVSDAPGGTFRVSAFDPAAKLRFWENLRKEDV